jgi:hypothetical protein
MGREGVATSVLDTGALIAIERRDERARGFLHRRRGRIIIPAPVLAQVWRNGARQAHLARFIASNGTTLEPLDELTAKAVGAILGRTGTSDVVDASVVVSARRHRAVVVTGDAADLRRMDLDLALEEI